MRVHDHLSQHETIGELQLMTESGTVTQVAAMDRSRNDEVIQQIRVLLDERGTEAWRRHRPSNNASCRRWIRDQLDRIERGTPLTQYLSKSTREGRIGEELNSLQARYLRPYPSLFRTRIETDAIVDFVAGQYIGVRFQGTTRVYSVASSPNRDDLEFCIRRVPGGRLTGTLAVELDPGDQVVLRGPYGDFVMEPPSRRDLVFLATGTGVAPFRSMIEFCFEEGRDEFRGETRDVWLFLGAAWKDDLPYREYFRTLGRDHENFHFVPTLSREEYLSNWDGETAYVQHVLAKYLDDAALETVSLPSAFHVALDEEPKEPIRRRLTPDTMEVYACGINAMVYGLVDAVERLGVPEEHTQFEGFG